MLSPFDNDQQEINAISEAYFGWQPKVDGVAPTDAMAAETGGQLARDQAYVAANPGLLRTVARGYAEESGEFDAPDGTGLAHMAEFIMAVDSTDPRLAVEILQQLKETVPATEGESPEIDALFNRLHNTPGLSLYTLNATSDIMRNGPQEEADLDAPKPAMSGTGTPSPL
jgi:hypothetical protein